MSALTALQQETREIIDDLLNDGSDPNALYIIEHHISHHDFDKLKKLHWMHLNSVMKFPKRKSLKMRMVEKSIALILLVKLN